jgi:hypothetical protein
VDHLPHGKKFADRTANKNDVRSWQEGIVQHITGFKFEGFAPCIPIIKQAVHKMGQAVEDK